MHLRNRLEMVFYLLGLFLVRYPRSAILFVAVIVIGCSLPLLSSFPTGDLHSPLTWKMATLNFLQREAGPGGRSQPQWIDKSKTTNFRMPIFLYAPTWFLGMPVAAVQQVTARVTLNCTTHPKYCLSRELHDAASAAARQLLRDLEQLDKSCGQVVHPVMPQLMKKFRLSREQDNRKDDKLEPVFAENVMSPALLLDMTNRPTLSSKVFTERDLFEVLYGGYWSEGGPLLTSFTGSFHMALTVLLDITPHNFQLVKSCIDELQGLWHGHGSLLPPSGGAVRHFFYEDAWEFADFLPISFLYFTVFIYISYSVGKINQVKSKWGVGCAAVLTVVASLTMSVGVCTYFGLNISVRGSEVIPYMIIIFGLENVLVIVKAVVSTRGNKDVKLKIAEALKQEGVAITTNFVTILLLLVLGCFVFSTAMQEFCIVGIVGVLCSLVLQVVFFPAVLSIDLLRKEGKVYSGQESLPEVLELASKIYLKLVLLTSFFPGALSDSDDDAPHGPCDRKWISKREKLAYFVANTRPIQRAMVVFLVAFVAYCAAQSDIRALFRDSTPRVNDIREQAHAPSSDSQGVEFRVHHITPTYVRQTCGLRKCWYPMAASHWPAILSHFNYSVDNRFISILSPITLGMELGVIDHQTISLRHFIVAAVAPILQEPYFYSILGAVSAFVLFLCFSWIHASKVLGRYREMYQARSKKKAKQIRSKPGPETLTLKGNSQIMCVTVSQGCVVSAGAGGYLTRWNPMLDNSLVTISRSSHFAKLLNLPRPPGEGRDHEEVSSGSVVVEQEAESPISVQITGRRLSTASCADSLASFNMAASEQDPSAGGGKGYDFAPYIDLYSPYTYKLALQYMPSCLERPKVPQAPPVWCVDMHEDVIVVGCGNGHVEAWSSSSRSLLWRYTASPRGVMTVLATARGVYTGLVDGSVCHLSQTGLRQKSLHSFQQSVSVMKAVGGRLVVGAYDGVVKVFQMSELQCQHTLRQHYGAITTLAVDEPPSLGCVTGCSGGIVCCWDLVKGSCEHVLDEHEGSIVRVSCTPTMVTSMAADCCIRVWDRARGTEVNVITLNEQCWDMTLLNASVLAVGVQNALILLSVKSGKELLRKQFDSHATSKKVSLVKQVLVLDSSHIVCTVGTDVKVVTIPVRYTKLD